MRLIKACIALAAFAAIFVVPSIASATSPTLFETTAGGSNDLVPVGTKVVATNVAHSGTALTTKLVSSAGNIECETATVTGTVTKNGAGVIQGEVTTAEFRGTSSNPHGTIHCNGGFGGLTTVTPSHTSDETASLPWCMRATEGDRFEVTGGTCAQQDEGKPKALNFRLHTATLGTCDYVRAAATGPVIGTYTTHPADAVVTINGGENAKFTKTAGSIFCPNTGELFMAFTLTTDDGNHETNAPLNVT